RAVDGLCARCHPGGERRCLLPRRRGTRPRGTPPPAGPGARSERGGAGQLPDRVVALELRRPVLGTRRRRPRRPLRPSRSPRPRRSDPMSAVCAAPLAPAPVSARASASLLTVDLAAIAANVATIRSRTAADVMAVVKADGFGHG